MRSIKNKLRSGLINRVRKEGLIRTLLYSHAVGKQLTVQTFRNSRVGRWYLHNRLFYLRRNNGIPWAANLSIDLLRERTLHWVDGLRLPGEPYGRYRYARHYNQPNLYASIYAALLRHLFRDTDNLKPEERKQWANYLLSHQGEDGLFRDPLIACPQATQLSWWGWTHLTLHALGALTCLGVKTYKPFLPLKELLTPEQMYRWLDNRTWQKSAADVSNEVQNVGVMLQYARDFQGDEKAGIALAALLDWLDDKQDPKTGLWFPKVDSPLNLSLSVQAAYHLWLLYFYDRRLVKYAERIIDTVLMTQNVLGGYGVSLNSTGCEDIDSIDPVVRLSKETTYRNEHVARSLEQGLIWVLTNFNSDGSAVFRREEEFLYVHPQMLEKKRSGSLFSTWWRTLSLAYLGQVITDRPVGRYQWQFVRCPGMQFW
jgi:hypothetical protein